jgi:TPR repeat protein
MRPIFPTLFLLVCAARVSAGECRGDLRPLLLDPEPDPAALQSVRRLCQTQADEGDADAVYGLALFELGLGGEWQPDRAIPRMMEAAGRGVSEAQYWLAWQYEAGPLMPHDQALALGWYQRAANADHRLAVARLARAHEAGELGLTRDPLLAAQYKARQSRCLASEAGSARALAE